MKNKVINFLGIILSFFLLIGFAISCLFALFRKPDNKKVNEAAIKPQDLKFSYKFKFTSAYEIKKSPDNRYFATIGGTVAIWDASTGKKITSFGQLKNPSHLNFSNSGKSLVVKNTSGKIALFDMDELKHLKSCTPTKEEGCEIYFTPDDKYLVSADWDGNIYTIDIKGGKTKILRSDKAVYITKKFLTFERKVMQKDRIMYRKLYFDSITNEFIFNGSLVWKYPFNKNEPKPVHHEYGMAYNKINRCYATTIIGNKVNKLLIKDEISDELLYESIVYNTNGQKAPIENVAWSPDGKTLALVARTGEYFQDNIYHTVQLFEYPNFNIIGEYKIPFAWFIEFTQDSKQLLIGGDKNSYCFDLNSEKKAETEINPEFDDLEKYIEENGLSKELLSQVGDSELIEALFFASEKIYGNIEHNSEADWVEKLPPLFKLAHLIYWFDNETSEGGLSQYIFNSQCELCAQLKEAFKMLNLPEHIKIINKAVKLYNSEELDMYDAKWEKLNEQCEELDENPIDALYKYICSEYN